MVMTRSNLWYNMFADDLDLPQLCRCRVYLPSRNLNLSRALAIKASIYIPYRNAHLSGVMIRSNLCYDTLTKNVDLPSMTVFASLGAIVRSLHITSHHTNLLASLPYQGVFAQTSPETNGQTSVPGPRLRRTGPKSAAAKSKRKAASNKQHTCEITRNADRKQLGLKRSEISDFVCKH